MRSTRILDGSGYNAEGSVGDVAVGSLFHRVIEAGATPGCRPATVPGLSGRARTTGTSPFLLDPGHPWPPAFGHLAGRDRVTVTPTTVFPRSEAP